MWGQAKYCGVRCMLPFWDKVLSILHPTVFLLPLKVGLVSSQLCTSAPSLVLMNS